MADSLAVMNNPMLWINAYLKDKVQSDLQLSFGVTKFSVPFFPSTPTALEDLYTMFPEGGSMCTYDRMIRMRRSPLPHIKSEQALYYFYAHSDDRISIMANIQESVLRWMDREDETAEEINQWCKDHKDDAVFQGYQPKFYFHRFKVYQLQEVRDIVDFGTARTYAGNKIIIDFDYHQDTSISR
jgi:hypothetical protein